MVPWIAEQLSDQKSFHGKALEWTESSGKDCARGIF